MTYGDIPRQHQEAAARLRSGSSSRLAAVVLIAAGLLLGTLGNIIGAVQAD
jgi:hypothetical protein